MRKDLLRSALAIAGFTLVLGLAYPLVMTGIAQVAFPHKADGSLDQGRRRQGHRLHAAGPRRQGRAAVLPPAALGDGLQRERRPTSATAGPTSGRRRSSPRQHLDAYIKAEKPYNPRLTPARVPIDAATFSASGVDPHISKANAAIQARRVAAVARLPLARVHQLIADSTDGRGLGVFGEPGVNTTVLNLALDQEAR